MQNQFCVGGIQLLMFVIRPASLSFLSLDGDRSIFFFIRWKLLLRLPLQLPGNICHLVGCKITHPLVKWAWNTVHDIAWMHLNVISHFLVEARGLRFFRFFIVHRFSASFHDCDAYNRHFIFSYFGTKSHPSNVWHRSIHFSVPVNYRVDYQSYFYHNVINMRQQQKIRWLEH